MLLSRYRRKKGRQDDRIQRVYLYVASRESSDVSLVANAVSDLDFHQCIIPVPTAPAPKE
jgi:hypothetical protein